MRFLTLSEVKLILINLDTFNLLIINFFSKYFNKYNYRLKNI